MKKLILISIILISISCTNNNRARNWGGTERIYLPKNERLIGATWKDDDIWYLTEPMPANYIPQIKKLTEKSSFGAYEGTLLFIESNDLENNPDTLKSPVVKPEDIQNLLNKIDTTKGSL